MASADIGLVSAISVLPAKSGLPAPLSSESLVKVTRRPVRSLAGGGIVVASFWFNSAKPWLSSARCVHAYGLSTTALDCLMKKSLSLSTGSDSAKSIWPSAAPPVPGAAPTAAAKSLASVGSSSNRPTMSIFFVSSAV